MGARAIARPCRRATRGDGSHDSHHAGDRSPDGGSGGAWAGEARAPMPGTIDSREARREACRPARPARRLRVPGRQGAGPVRRQGRLAAEPGPLLLPGVPAPGRQDRRPGAPHPRPRVHRHRQRAGSADARGQPGPQAPPAVQHHSSGRQALPVSQAHHQRGLPAAPRGPAGRTTTVPSTTARSTRPPRCGKRCGWSASSSRCGPAPSRSTAAWNGRVCSTISSVATRPARDGRRAKAMPTRCMRCRTSWRARRTTWPSG